MAEVKGIKCPALNKDFRSSRHSPTPDLEVAVAFSPVPVAYSPIPNGKAQDYVVATQLWCDEYIHETGECRIKRKNKVEDNKICTFVGSGYKLPLDIANLTKSQDTGQR